MHAAETQGIERLAPAVGTGSNPGDTAFQATKIVHDGEDAEVLGGRHGMRQNQGDSGAYPAVPFRNVPTRKQDSNATVNPSTTERWPSIMAGTPRVSRRWRLV